MFWGLRFEGWGFSNVSGFPTFAGGGRDRDVMEWGFGFGEKRGEG